MTHDQVDTILKITGSGLSGFGSLILAWRVRGIIKWITYSLVAHDITLVQIRRRLEGKPQIENFVEGHKTQQV
jgi:hypothetical protein